MICALTLTPAQLALKAKVEGVPEIPYEAVPNFFKLPDGFYFGECLGVATNCTGHTFVYGRGHRTRILEFDQTGKFLRFVGDGVYGKWETAGIGAFRSTITTENSKLSRGGAVGHLH